MVQVTNKLVTEKGILPSLTVKPGKALPLAKAALVK
jgi:hypothetical protein